MIRAAAAAIAGTVPRLIVLAVIVASTAAFLGLGGPACAVALLVQVVWASLFVLTYQLLRTAADIAGVLQAEEQPHGRD